MTENTQTIALPNIESAIALAGIQEENLQFIARHTGANLILRGQDLVIYGKEKPVQRSIDVVNFLKPYWDTAKSITQPDILTAFQALDTGRVEEYQDIQNDVLAKTRHGELIRAKTFRQRQYVKAIKKYDITFGIGPAGTGKTFLGAVIAVQALLNGECDRLILTRPAVEAGEKLGFLPGDLQQKVNPFLRPLYDALYEFIEPIKIPDLMERGKIEVAPLAYMRGRTLSNAFVIVDEAQNTTPAQLKMVLTRLGFGSKMIVTGDITQTDLPSHQESGLVVATKILKNVEGIGFCYLTQADVVRHPLVQKIVAAYEKEHC
ncbi:PhoH family protein [Cyanobacterium aponinum UTEX 3222]|uniref:PhoH-like protein n=1 Tax=Cyanobacterium aponinum AL20115 TaxID=3090662 RepID=A0AAF0ZEB3_9CHRO|nr:PhoH family protein [Cyanobacterium aponinum]WPF87302.1 PhoH family protein [Cyanobacterium aponinum AL20115]WRL39247.1 PhoH family protein [Cyanobacterium aponinum UTEX 3221]WRL40464.1 PhoH family protein [Cyanobacterium aponinum UTEX 3222]